MRCTTFRRASAFGDSVTAAPEAARDGMGDCFEAGESTDLTRTESSATARCGAPEAAHGCLVAPQAGGDRSECDSVTGVRRRGQTPPITRTLIRQRRTCGR